MSTFKRDVVLETVVGTFGIPALEQTQVIVVTRDDGEVLVCTYQGEEYHSNEGTQQGTYTDCTLLDLASFAAVADALKERGLI